MTPGCAAMARAWPVNHLDSRRKHLVDAVADDGMSLAAANFHDLPRAPGDLMNLTRHALGDFAIAELGEVLHFLPPVLIGS